MTSRNDESFRKLAVNVKAKMNGANYAAAGPVDARKQLIIWLGAALETDIHYYPSEAAKGPITPPLLISETGKRKKTYLVWAAC